MNEPWGVCSWWRKQMETFRVTGPLCGEFTGHRWFPLTKASDAELWCFLLICAWTNGWVNNRDAGDLRRHRAHYVVIVMSLSCVTASLLSYQKSIDTVRLILIHMCWTELCYHWFKYWCSVVWYQAITWTNTDFHKWMHTIPSLGDIAHWGLDWSPIIYPASTYSIRSFVKSVWVRFRVAAVLLPGFATNC